MSEEMPPSPLSPAKAGAQAFSEALGCGEMVKGLTTNLTNHANRQS
jgi:hypothetical protein